MRHCNGCTANYVPTAKACPNCGAEGYHERNDGSDECSSCPHCDDDDEEADMAKSTRLGGPTNANDLTMVEETGPELVELPDEAKLTEEEMKAFGAATAGANDADTVTESNPVELVTERPANGDRKALWVGYVAHLIRLTEGAPNVEDRKSVV